MNFVLALISYEVALNLWLMLAVVVLLLVITVRLRTVKTHLRIARSNYQLKSNLLNSSSHKLSESHAELRRVGSDLATAKVALHKLEWQLEDTHRNYITARDDLEEVRAELDVAQSERDQFCERLTESEYKRNKLQEDLDFTRSMVNR